jgi:hypothetical protein
VLLVALLVALAGTKTTAAQQSTTIFIFNMKSSIVYDVAKNGSALTSVYTSPNGALRFADTATPGDLISVAEDSTAAAVTISAFEATTDGGAVKLDWDVFSDESLSGYVVYRTERAGPERGTPVHGERFLPPAARSLVDRSVVPETWYRYTLVVVREDGVEAASLSRTVRTHAVLLELEQNTPNPFNPQTSISFVLPAASTVRLELFDVEGRRVSTLVDGKLPPGRHSFRWDGTDRNGTPVATGTYFYRLKAGKRSLSRKMLLLK